MGFTPGSSSRSSGRVPSRSDNRMSPRSALSAPRRTQGAVITGNRGSSRNNPFVRIGNSSRALREQSSTATLRPSSTTRGLRGSSSRNNFRENHQSSPRNATRSRAIVEIQAPGTSQRTLNHTPSVMHLPRQNNPAPSPSSRSRPSSNSSMSLNASQQRINAAMTERRIALEQRNSRRETPQWPPQGNSSAASNPFRPSSSLIGGQPSWSHQMPQWPVPVMHSARGRYPNGSASVVITNSPVARRSGVAYPAPMHPESGFQYPHNE
jgi:hypothetical protein